MGRFFNVFISDGNRLCNYDCKTDMTLVELLKLRKYNWIRGTVRVNGKPIANSDVGKTLDALQCETLNGKPWRERMTVKCQTPADDPSKKIHRPARDRKQEQEVQDVR